MFFIKFYYFKSTHIIYLTPHPCSLWEKALNAIKNSHLQVNFYLTSFFSVNIPNMFIVVTSNGVWCWFWNWFEFQVIFSTKRFLHVDTWIICTFLLFFCSLCGSSTYLIWMNFKIHLAPSKFYVKMNIKNYQYVELTHNVHIFWMSLWWSTRQLVCNCPQPVPTKTSSRECLGLIFHEILTAFDQNSLCRLLHSRERHLKMQKNMQVKRLSISFLFSCIWILNQTDGESLNWELLYWFTQGQIKLFFFWYKVVVVGDFYIAHQYHLNYKLIWTEITNCFNSWILLYFRSESIGLIQFKFIQLLIDVTYGQFNKNIQRFLNCCMGFLRIISWNNVDVHILTTMHALVWLLQWYQLHIIYL